MEIAFHIQEIAKLYPIIVSTVGNLADGRIENWSNLLSDKIELPKPGSYIMMDSSLNFHFKTYSYYELWVHLGNSYFKQVLKKSTTL